MNQFLFLINVKVVHIRNFILSPYKDDGIAKQLYAYLKYKSFRVVMWGLSSETRDYVTSYIVVLSRNYYYHKGCGLSVAVVEHNSFN